MRILFFIHTFIFCRPVECIVTAFFFCRKSPTYFYKTSLLCSLSDKCDTVNWIQYSAFSYTSNIKPFTRRYSIRIFIRLSLCLYGVWCMAVWASYKFVGWVAGFFLLSLYIQFMSFYWKNSFIKEYFVVYVSVRLCMVVCVSSTHRVFMNENRSSLLDDCWCCCWYCCFRHVCIVFIEAKRRQQNQLQQTFQSNNSIFCYFLLSVMCVRSILIRLPHMIPNEWVA